MDDKFRPLGVGVAKATVKLSARFSGIAASSRQAMAEQKP